VAAVRQCQPGVVVAVVGGGRHGGGDGDGGDITYYSC
jgi:hypothetical protein